MILDGFLKTFDDLEEALSKANFCDIENPIDGIIYPLISLDIPDNVKDEVLSNLSVIAGKEISDYTMFMRRSPEGIYCSNKAHTDKVIGDYSCMIYLQDNQSAGTSLIKHRLSGISYHPGSKEFEDIVASDANNDDAWDIVDYVEMVKNRAFIFRSDMFHRAEPVGGFGQGDEARTVLTCFFS